MSTAHRAEDVVIVVEGRPALVRRRQGAGDAALPTLVLVHGAGGNHLSFEPVLAALPPELEVLVPALPGRLSSEGPACRTVREMASFVASVARSQVSSRWVVAGHSLGGAVALELALMREEPGADLGSLAGVVLMATGARLRVHPAILAMMQKAADTGAEVPAVGFRAGTPAALIAETAKTSALTPSSAALCDWQAADEFDRMKDLGRIAVPTLVLSGAADDLTPAKYASYLAANIRGAREASLEGGGHLFPIERGVETASHLARFVTELT